MIKKLMPKVSVIIPTYNRANYIGGAINSVLEQTYKDFEVIVIDDGSTDNTRETVGAFNGHVQYHYQTNKGLSAARNLGISKARGEYIAFLDSDDLWTPDRLETQSRILDENPSLGFVCSETYVINAAGETIGIWKKGISSSETFKSLYAKNFVFTLTVTVRRICLEEIGSFDEHLVMCQDYDLWLRLAKRYEFKFIAKPLAKYRLHDNNMSKNFELRMKEHRFIVAKPEISRGVDFVHKRLQSANDHYQAADYYERQEKYAAACVNYLEAVLAYPLIGYFYWPREVEHLRFSLPYRIIKPYLSFLRCAVRPARFFTKKIIRFSFKAWVFFLVVINCLRCSKNQRGAAKKIGLLNIEFFHQEAGGFGGYGKCAKNIVDYFNSGNKKDAVSVDVLLTRPDQKPGMRCLHSTTVLLAPDSEGSGFLDIFRYAQMLFRRKIGMLVTMEYYPAYQYSIFLLPRTPLLIWIRDPRPAEELERIAGVTLERTVAGDNTMENTKRHARYKSVSIKKIMALSKIFKRKICFATTAHSLVELAKKTYELGDINAFLLPTPVMIPSFEKPTYSQRPSFCFLGRLDPIKRPWIFFELAKRFKDAYFYVAGKSHFPEIMDSVVQKYSHVPNLKFSGFLDGEAKDRLLKNMWGLINTSVHEALPVSFLEAFAYGKPIITCQNPDGFAQRFGIYTGELLGDCYDEKAVDIFSDALKDFFARQEEMKEKGRAAREFVKKNYSFEKFTEVLESIQNELTR